jgi:hypothetical protein
MPDHRVCPVPLALGSRPDGYAPTAYREPDARIGAAWGSQSGVESFPETRSQRPADGPDPAWGSSTFAGVRHEADERPSDPPPAREVTAGVRSDDRDQRRDAAQLGAGRRCLRTALPRPATKGLRRSSSRSTRRTASSSRSSLRRMYSRRAWVISVW